VTRKTNQQPLPHDRRDRRRRFGNRSRLRAQLLVLILALFAANSRAEIEIEIPKVSAQIESNIRGFLSLTRYAERTDVTPEVMSRLQRRIVTETRRALEPLGYYEPDVDYRVEPQGEGKWQVTILVTPGRPVRLSAVEIDIKGPGAAARPLKELRETADLKPGLRLNHGAYERVKGELVRTAKNEGYLDAVLTAQELAIDRIERRASVKLVLETGERYFFGPIEVTQEVIQEDAMRRLLRMKEGDPYTLDALLRTQYVLDDTQYFSLVDIDSADPDRTSRTVAIKIHAQPSRKHRFAVSLGYATDTQARGKFTWDNRRVNDSGHRLKTELIASSVLSEISTRYVIPVMDVALEKLEFTAIANEEELGDTFSEVYEIGSGLTQALGRWQRVLFLRFSDETTTFPFDGVNPEYETQQFLIIPGISYSTLPSYVVGGKLRPYHLYAELRGSPSTLGSEASFLQLRLQGERIFELAPRWHLRLRAEIGASWVPEFSDLPASQRFFAGGDRSVRGFDLNELSPPPEPVPGQPTRTLETSVGGRHLITGTIEFERDLPKNFGAAAFFDFGNAFNDFGDPLEYSVGLGARYHIAVASLGVDVAQPLSESDRGPKLHLFISTLF
jgi:translocation and assembly module TamA